MIRGCFAAALVGLGSMVGPRLGSDLLKPFGIGSGRVGLPLPACSQRVSHLAVRWLQARCPAEELARMLKLVQPQAGKAFSVEALDRILVVEQCLVARLNSFAPEGRARGGVSWSAFIVPSRRLLALRHLDVTHRLVEPCNRRERVLLRVRVRATLRLKVRVRVRVHLRG